MQRRTFIAGGVAAAAAIAAGAYGGKRWFDGDDSGTRQYGDTVLRQRRASSDAPNVLFISIDDSNDWMGFLNDHPGTHTPNLDALAAQSLVFDHAYAHAPICLPSRSAVMFGLPGWETGVVDHTQESRARYEEMAAVTPSLTDDFWAAGYETIGAGKIFHHAEPSRWDHYKRTEFYASQFRGQEGARYDPKWISPYDDEPIGDGRRFQERIIDFGPTGKGPAEEPDGISTAWIDEKLRERRSKPLFCGLGFLLPHEPWRLPQRYFDLHPLDEVVVPDIRPADLWDLPVYARRHIIDQHHTFRLLQEQGLLEEVVQAYQAAQSFVDDRLGIVLDQLASSPYADDTIVAVWSDHGYHLGEKMHVEKFTLWERATRVPLVLHAPGRFDRAQRFEPPVGLIDLGPTLADLCDVRIHADHAGASLLPLVADERLANDRAPITMWEHGNYAVRRGPWRYIRYRTGAEELYDNRNDPDELVNLAKRGTHTAVEDELAALLPADRYATGG